MHSITFSASIFARCLRPTKQGFFPLQVPFWRKDLPTPVALLPSPLSLSTPLFRAAFRPWQGPVSRVQTFASSSARLRQETALSSTDPKSIVTAVPVYKHSPASFGVETWGGSYEQMIASDTVLPCQRSVTLTSAVDHIGDDTMRVSGCLPKSYLRTTLAEVLMLKLRKANKLDTTMEAIMVLKPDLRGRFTARFASETGSTEEVSVEFDGARILQRGDGGAPLPVQSHESSQSSSPSLVEGCGGSWV